MALNIKRVALLTGLTVILLRASPTYADTRSLDSWLAEAKAAESVLTGEAVEQIPDSRFFAETRAENNRRLVTAVGQIDDTEEHLIFLIGKNLTPTGLILKDLYREEIEYSNLIVDTLEAGDEYTVARFAVQRRYSEGQCDHQWETSIRRPASCLSDGRESHQCRRCGRSYDVVLPALGHQDLTGDRICDRCGESVDSGIPESRTWRVGDVQARVIDGETYLFRCIDENYTDGMALFLCEQIIPADWGSRYVYEEQEDGSYAYVFHPGPIVNFGETSDYKLSSIRSWLKRQEENFLNVASVQTGVETAYTGSTDQGLMGQLNTSGLTSHAIGSQSMTDKLFVLSLDEAIRYKDWLWRFDGFPSENPESQYGAYSKGYWLRTPMGTSSNDTGYVYIVDTVNGNIRPAAIRPESGSGNEEADSTVSIGIRPAFAVPQG